MGYLEGGQDRLVQHARRVDEDVVKGAGRKRDERLKVFGRSAEAFGEALGSAEQERAGFVDGEAALEGLELEFGLVAGGARSRNGGVEVEQDARVAEVGVEVDEED